MTINQTNGGSGRFPTRDTVRDTRYGDAFGNVDISQVLRIAKYILGKIRRGSEVKDGDVGRLKTVYQEFGKAVFDSKHLSWEDCVNLAELIGENKLHVFDRTMLTKGEKARDKSLNFRTDIQAAKTALKESSSTKFSVNDLPERFRTNKLAQPEGEFPAVPPLAAVGSNRFKKAEPLNGNGKGDISIQEFKEKFGMKAEPPKSKRNEQGGCFNKAVVLLISFVPLFGFAKFERKAIEPKSEIKLTDAESKRSPKPTGDLSKPPSSSQVK